MRWAHRIDRAFAIHQLDKASTVFISPMIRNLNKWQFHVSVPGNGYMVFASDKNRAVAGRRAPNSTWIEMGTLALVNPEGELSQLVFGAGGDIRMP